MPWMGPHDKIDLSDAYKHRPLAEGDGDMEQAEDSVTVGQLESGQTLEHDKCWQHRSGRSGRRPHGLKGK